MVLMRRVRISRISNAAIFFILTFIQVIIVSWVAISQIPKSDYIIEQFFIFGFYISFNPFVDLRFTAILVLLTAGLQLLLLAFLVNVVFSNKNMVQIYPEPLYGPAHAPEETPLVEKTIELVTGVSQKAGIKVKKIFVYRKAVPNAFSLDLSPVPFFRRAYLVLNTNVLEILGDTEIEGVIAHEIAHLSHGDSLVRLVLSIPRLYLNLAYFFIYLQILTGILDAIFNSFNIASAIDRTIFLALTYVIIAIVSKFTVRFLYSANHQAEYLADYFAAQLVGSDVLINSLIHLGQRSEAMQVLSREIDWLQSLSGEKKAPISFIRNIYQRFPKTQLDEDIARELAPKLFLEEKIDQLITVYGIELDYDLRKKLVSQAVPTLLQRREKYFANLEDEDTDFTPSFLKAKTIDWRKFDSDASQTLEADEIGGFIATLIAQPDKMVFEHELFQSSEKSDHDHPSFRDRILRIFSIFHLEEYKNIQAQVLEEKELHSKTTAS